MDMLFIEANQAYTSKTVSWTSKIIENLGSKKLIRSSLLALLYISIIFNYAIVSLSHLFYHFIHHHTEIHHHFDSHHQQHSHNELIDAMIESMHDEKNEQPDLSFIEEIQLKEHIRVKDIALLEHSAWKTLLKIAASQKPTAIYLKPLTPPPKQLYRLTSIYFQFIFQNLKHWQDSSIYK